MSPAFLALVQASAGAVGGTFAAFFLMPLEVAKTRIQISQTGDASLLGSMGEIFKREGVPGLFSGVSVKCFETGSKNFIYFYIYDAINTITKRRAKLKLTTVVKLIIGYLAGVVCTVLTMPLEVLSTRLQADTRQRLSGLALLWRVLGEEGLEGLFKGFWFNIILCVNPAIQNTCFDRMKTSVLRTRPALTPSQAFVLGAIAKAAATVVTFPLVRLKTMLQAGKQPSEPMAPQEVKEPINAEASKLHDGARPLLRKASTPVMLGRLQYREDRRKSEQIGLLQRCAQLYRGVGSALWKSVLQAALLYMTKDQVEQLVVQVFRLSAKMLRRRNGSLKLAVTSGRPLPGQ